MNDNVRPRLVEPGMKYYINETLKQCHSKREFFNNIIFNISLLVVFLLLLSGILFYKYRGKLTPVEKYMKNKNQYQYILSQIKKVNIAHKNANQELITGLPLW